MHIAYLAIGECRSLSFTYVISLAWSVEISHGNGLVLLLCYFCEREDRLEPHLNRVTYVVSEAQTVFGEDKKASHLYPANESKHGGTM